MRRKEGRGGRRDEEERGTRRKEGRGGRRNGESEKMKKLLKQGQQTKVACAQLIQILPKVKDL